MPASPQRWKKTVIVATGAVGLAWCIVATGIGGASPRHAAARLAGTSDQKKPMKPFYWMAGGPSIENSCGSAGCHGRKEESTGAVCRLTEFHDWKHKDKHSDAYKVLLDPLAQKMGKRLGWDDVSKRKECVACHGVVIRLGDRDLVAYQGYKNDEFLEEGFKPEEEGVTCSVCHGPYEAWRNAHALPKNLKAWRKKKRDDKEKEVGMKDLWDPVKRTALCASCHVGNHGQGKFVTHAMYAAGHPPLPSFEVATFCDQMPHHWQYLRDKSPLAKGLLQYKENEQEQAKLALVGAVVTLRESMRLLAGQAADCQKALADTTSDPDRRALDLSNFDCYACHHNLGSSSWRQERRSTGKPGRPPMPSWPTALVDLAVEALGSDEESEKLRAEYPGLLKKVQEAFTMRIYGDPEQVRKTANKLMDWADTVTGKLNSKKDWDVKAARKALQALPKLYKDRILDYDSARQVAWAFQTMYLEQKGEDETKKVLRPLEEYLKLTFPKGKTRIESELGLRLTTRNKYEPRKFQKELNQLPFKPSGKK